LVPVVFKKADSERAVSCGGTVDASDPDQNIVLQELKKIQKREREIIRPSSQAS
jgi:hypothetical protein